MNTLIRLSILLLVGAIYAGGPINRDSNGVPLRHPIDQVLTYNVDQGDLSTIWQNNEVLVFVNEEFAEWDAVPGSALRIQAGPQLSVDITTMDEINTALTNGENPIVFDETGTVFQDFGFSPNAGVLAFAGPVGFPNQPYIGMFAVMGGAASLNATGDSLRSTLIHEFGHALGLGHSQVNGGFIVGGAPQTYEDFGFPGQSTIEIMFWNAVSSNSSLNVDDISGYLELYGDGNTGAPGFGGISGQVFLPDGVNPADGINVIVRDRSGGRDTVFLNAASTITCCQGETNTGTYSITALPPGQYSVEIRDVLRNSFESNASYSDAIRTDTPNNSTSGGVIGPFPGDEEFYNGDDESNNGGTDDPTALTLITVTADTIVTGVDLFFNREEGEKGTTLPNVYNLPQVRAGGDNDTYVGIVNPNGAEANIQIIGFGVDGTEYLTGAAPTTISALGRLWLSTNALWPESAGDIAWIQVGGGSALHVYAELQEPAMAAAYWASEGVLANSIMPHVARNTATFDTYVSSVNAQSTPTNATLTAEPTNDEASMSDLATPFAKYERNLEDVFGSDLTPIDWVRIDADEVATASMEYFTTPANNPTQMAGLDLTNERGTTLRFLHIATDTSLFWTGLVYINISDVDVTATETYYNAAGDVIKTEEVPLAPGQKITLLFDANNQERVPAGSSWMQVTVPTDSGAELVGYELFGSFNFDSQDVFTGLRSNYDSAISLDFPHFETGGNAFTALVATNLGDESADLDFIAYDADGQILGNAVQTGIAPRQKFTGLVSQLFDEAVRADLAWIRVQPTGSRWAGFMLWGDLSAPRQNLSGIVAAGRGTGTVSGRSVINETTAVHNSYDTAQVIEPVDGVFDVNLLGSIDQDGGTGPVVNNFGNGLDGIEDIYQITLTEPKTLVIAVAPDNLNADLDLFVINGELANQNFFADRFNPNIDYSGTGGGVESLTRQFEPGTYYIFVTLFEGDVFPNANYGLLITENAIIGESFEDPTVLVNDWSLATLNSDSDGQANWTYDSGFVGNKYGSFLRQDPTGMAGLQENSVLISPLVTIPTTGLTVYDFDFGAFGTTIGSSDTVTPYWVDANLGITTSASFGGAAFNEGTSGSDVNYDGGTAPFVSWQRWVAVANAIGGGSTVPVADITPGDLLLGEERSIGVAATSTNGSISVDNIRVYNMITSLNAKTKPGQVIDASKREPKPFTKSLFAPRDVAVFYNALTSFRWR